MSGSQSSAGQKCPEMRVNMPPFENNSKTAAAAAMVVTREVPLSIYPKDELIPPLGSQQGDAIVGQIQERRKKDNSFSSPGVAENVEKSIETLNDLVYEGVDKEESGDSKAIDKVPEILKSKENEDCFVPKLFLLGRYNFARESNDPGNHGLFHGLHLKNVFIKEFFKDKEDSVVSSMFSEIKKIAPELRKCYIGGPPPEKMTDYMFTLKMLQDGCSILGFIRCVVRKEIDTMVDKKMILKHEVRQIMDDLFLLENQVPYLLLKTLMDGMGYNKEGEAYGLFDDFVNTQIQLPVNIRQQFSARCTNCFYLLKESIHNLMKGQKFKEGPSVGGQDRRHLLDILWRKQFGGGGKTGKMPAEALAPLARASSATVPTSRKDGGQTYGSWYTFRSVRELKSAGINFTVSYDKTVKFMRMPVLFYKAFICLDPLCVDDSTKKMLLNLSAYEMSSHGPNQYPVCSYLHFMDSMIDNADDVKELRRSNVILNALGNDQLVADLFNELPKYLISTRHNRDVYQVVQDQIEAHCRSTIKVWIAEWNNTHFSNPWAFLAFLGAVLALVLTFLQTILAYMALPEVKKH